LGGKFSALKLHGTGRLLILLAVLSFGLVSSAILRSPTTLQPSTHLIQTPAPTLSPSSVNASTARVFITPGNITDLHRANPAVTFGVNVSDSPPITGFSVVLLYNSTVFGTSGAESINTNGNVLGPSSRTTTLEQCINDEPAGGSCEGIDGSALGSVSRSTGEVGVTLVYSGNYATPNATSGLLFSVTFNVLQSGFSQVHIFSAQLTVPNVAGKSNLVPLFPSRADGYYTSLSCPQGSNTSCQPPQVSVAVTPPRPSRDGLASFKANVTDGNPHAKVLRYAWNWGDSTGGVNQTNFSSSITHVFSSGSCVSAGNCTVTMTVFDNESIVWSTSIIVSILSLSLHLYAGSPQISPGASYYHPGNIIYIKAYIFNVSPVAENASLTITVEGKTLNSSSYSLAASGGSGYETAVWNTTGFVPRYYAVLANILISSIVTSTPISTRSGPMLVFGENDTSGETASAYVLLRVVQVTGALSLIDSVGVGALVLIGAGIGLSRVLKKPSYESEPLEDGK
jgi:hypothetical protein